MIIDKKKHILLITSGSIGYKILTSLLSIGFKNILIFKCKDYTSKLKWSSKNKKISINYENLDELDDKYIKKIDLVIIASEKILPKLYERVNIFCLKNRKTLISSMLINGYGVIGPTIIPYKTPCFKCYMNRINSNKNELNNNIFWNHTPTNSNNHIYEEYLKIITAYTILEIMKISSKNLKPTTLGSILLLDFNNYTFQLKNLFKIPNCDACGE